jgi:hypothetical protein
VRPKLGNNPSLLYCHVTEAFLTQVKGVVSYHGSAHRRQLVGDISDKARSAGWASNYNASECGCSPSLGRALSGGRANVTVNVVEPGTLYASGSIRWTCDFRSWALCRGSDAPQIDVYNALNSSTVLTEKRQLRTAWRSPTLILVARFIKFSAQVNF